MDPYGMDSDMGSMGGFFAFNKMMSDMSKQNSTNNENSAPHSQNKNIPINHNQSGPASNFSFFETGRMSSSIPANIENTNQKPNLQNANAIVPCSECTYLKNGKRCITTACNQCSHYNKISSLSPDRDEKSTTPVRDEPPSLPNIHPPLFNADERECSYFRKGLPCPFPACKYKCYDVPERLPAVAKRQLSPNADPNVKLCDYYKYERPCPFPRCRYKCYEAREKQKHFEMGYIRPIMNTRRHGSMDNRQIRRDVDHRAAVPQRRDSWEDKCDEFIRNMFDSKTSTTPPKTEIVEESENSTKKRKSHDKSEEASSRKRSKKKHSRDREEEVNNGSSKKKKSKKEKKDKKDKKSKKSKREHHKHEKSSSKDLKHKKSTSATNDSEEIVTLISATDSSTSIEPPLKANIGSNIPTPAFFEFIVSNFRKSSKKKLPAELQLEGLFKCEDSNTSKYSTEHAKIELITTKTIEFLNESGYNEDKIYDISTLLDGETLEKELKNVVYDAVKSGKIGHSKTVISQLFHVIELGKQIEKNLLNFRSLCYIFYKIFLIHRTYVCDISIF